MLETGETYGAWHSIICSK